MEFLGNFLPIVIYILLIMLIIVGIVLGIKLIITIDKVEKAVNVVNDKIEKVSPVFDALGTISHKMSDIISVVINSIENLMMRLFVKNNNKERESEEDE